MKHTKKIICLLAVFVLLMATTAVSFADTEEQGKVTYRGQVEKFLFEPGSDYSKTDLFTKGFKGVMPGDQITDTIQVRNDASNEVNVEIFMRALGSTDLQNPEDGNYEVSQQDSNEFLQQLGLNVIHENGTVLFDAQANETAQLTDWVSLGMFKSGEIVNLNVVLTVPLDLEAADDNIYQNAIGALDWQFKVIETPVPQTGDDSDMIVPLALMGVAALAIILALAGRRRKQEQ